MANRSEVNRVQRTDDAPEAPARVALRQVNEDAFRAFMRHKGWSTRAGSFGGRLYYENAKPSSEGPIGGDLIGKVVDGADGVPVEFWIRST